MSEEAAPKNATAAELLSEWRAAEREVIPAQETLDVADLAAQAAEAAVVAALETSEAARMSKEAAERAEESAARSAQAAEVTAHAATKERGSADAVLQDATEAEADAAARFREAQRQGFPKS